MLPICPPLTGFDEMNAIIYNLICVYISCKLWPNPNCQPNSSDKHWVQSVLAKNVQTSNSSVGLFLYNFWPILRSFELQASAGYQITVPSRPWAAQKGQPVGLMGTECWPSLISNKKCNFHINSVIVGNRFWPNCSQRVQQKSAELVWRLGKP